MICKYFLQFCSLPFLSVDYVPRCTEVLKFFLIYLFYLFLFLAVLGLCCCAQAFSSCGERGLLFVVVHRLLTAVASLVAEHGL